MVTLCEATVTAAEEAGFFDRLSEIGAETDCLIQAVDARYIAGPIHVETAVEHTRRAIANDTQIADDPAIELLLYLAGTRQIDSAMTIGVDPEGPTDAVIVIDGEDEQGARNAVSTDPAVTPATVQVGAESMLESWFDITAAERDATAASLELLVSERVALLAVDR